MAQPQCLPAGIAAGHGLPAISAMKTHFRARGRAAMMPPSAPGIAALAEQTMREPLLFAYDGHIPTAHAAAPATGRPSATFDMRFSLSCFSFSSRPRRPPPARSGRRRPSRSFPRVSELLSRATVLLRRRDTCRAQQPSCHADGVLTDSWSCRRDSQPIGITDIDKKLAAEARPPRTLMRSDGQRDGRHIFSTAALCC